jgi:glutamyl-Q tRNA(Asp) synthetase
MTQTQTVTRFAPSPTGRLHLGHAYSALFAHDAAKAAGGRFLLRIEDIDETRCRPEFVEGIEEDLQWLGLDWDPLVRHQSRHLGDYSIALGQLGNDGLIYPGTCRDMSAEECQERMEAGEPFAFRLDMEEALSRVSGLTWHDRVRGKIKAQPEIFGDIVLARKDIPTSYHLAVTHDDNAQGVTLVTRGADLFKATHVHRLLQSLLKLNTPEYHHHKIIADDEGKRLAKRENAPTLEALRKSGKTPDDIRKIVGL